MIKAEELRKGNLVNAQLEGEIITPFHRVTGSDISLGDATGVINMFFPILLTPEILDVFGLKDFSETLYEHEEYSIGIDTTGVYVSGQVIYGNPTIATPKYLHQLQNLYYALSGKELEVKLPHLA